MGTKMMNSFRSVHNSAKIDLNLLAHQVASFYRCPTMITTTFIVMSVALLVVLLYHLFFFARVAFKQEELEPDRVKPVTVVICARDEALHLERLIPLLLNQDHEQFEVLVVNDRSTDQSADILRWMEMDNENLRVVSIPPNSRGEAGKKMALWIGMREAKYPHVVVTDADCTPASRDWLALMAAGMPDGKSIVVANSPYERGSGITNILERYDGAMKALQFLGFAKAGIPYMGVGRNLGYQRDLFLQSKDKVKGWQNMSGDDDLFVNAVASAQNTTALMDPDSFMFTRATTDLRTWWRRKRRHYTTAVHYRFLHQFLLLLLPLARTTFWVSMVFLALQQNWIGVATGAIAFLVFFLPIQIKGLQKTGAADLAWMALPLEWLFLILDPFIYLSTLIVKPRQWK